MKTKQYLLIAFAALLLFFQGSCEKDNKCPNYELPPATQTGANTIGCKVNGQVCIPKIAGLFSLKTKRLCYNEENGELNLYFYFIANDKDIECNYPRMSINLSADSISNEGVYNIFSSVVEIDYSDGGGGSALHHYSATGYTGQLFISKLDKTSRIISGTFDYEAIRWIISDEYDFNQIAQVTEGRFDFTYNEDGSCVEGYSN